MAKTLVLNNGVEEYIINDVFGEELCRIHVVGGDIGIIDRYRKLRDDFDDIIAPLQDMEIKDDGTPVTEDSEEDSEKVMDSLVKNLGIIRKVENNLIDRINEVFCTRDAAKLFETRSAFSTVNGVFFAQIVIDMLNGIVADTIQEENKKSEARMKKYMKEQEKKK